MVSQENIVLDIGVSSILIILSLFFQYFLNLPTGSWSSLMIPSVLLFFITRLIFHYVYLLKTNINKYIINNKINNNIIKVLVLLTQVLPFVMLYIYCQIVLSVNPSIAESFRSMYASIIGDLPAILLKHSSPDIEKAKTLASKLLAILFCWFILLFLIETGLSLSLHSIAYAIKNISHVYNEITKPKTIIRKKIVKKSSNGDVVKDDDKDDDN